MFHGYSETVSEQLRRTDDAIAWRERQDWERAHLPPLGDGAEAANEAPAKSAQAAFAQAVQEAKTRAGARSPAGETEDQQ